MLSIAVAKRFNFHWLLQISKMKLSKLQVNLNTKILGIKIILLKPRGKNKLRTRHSKEAFIHS